MRWGLIGAGLGVLTIMALTGIELAANNYGVWLVALLPIGAVMGGALLLAGWEP